MRHFSKLLFLGLSCVVLAMTGFAQGTSTLFAILISYFAVFFV